MLSGHAPVILMLFVSHADDETLQCGCVYTRLGRGYQPAQVYADVTHVASFLEASPNVRGRSTITNNTAAYLICPVYIPVHS